jgi:isopentenyl-diphosphate Delta-isomerase
MGTEERKNEHLELFKQFDLSVRKKTNGFENWDWIPDETAEVDFNAIRTDTSFLGYSLSFPFMIAALSGGSEKGNTLNEDLAGIAEAEKIPLGTGSVRSALENPDHSRFFYRLRDLAPSVPLLVNIGIGQIRDKSIRKNVLNLIQIGRFDALVIHFNKIQELIQPEGNKNFTGITAAMSQLVETAGIPVIAKQVGHGFSRKDIRIIRDTGIRFMDLGGAGGSSWSRAERIRNGDTAEDDPFDEWGISTAESLVSALDTCPDMYCIAGGGIKTGHDLAKGLALGARLTSSANAVYQAYIHGGQVEVVKFLRKSRLILKEIMFLTGCTSIDTFRGNPYILRRIND